MPSLSAVFPAKAGTQIPLYSSEMARWIFAFAGSTGMGNKVVASCPSELGDHQFRFGVISWVASLRSQ